MKNESNDGRPRRRNAARTRAAAEASAVRLTNGVEELAAPRGRGRHSLLSCCPVNANSLFIISFLGRDDVSLPALLSLLL